MGLNFSDFIVEPSHLAVGTDIVHWPCSNLDIDDFMFALTSLKASMQIKSYPLRLLDKD